MQLYMIILKLKKRAKLTDHVNKAHIKNNTVNNANSISKKSHKK